MLGSEISPTEGVHVTGKLSTTSEDANNTMDFRKCIAFIGASYFLFMTSFVVPIACVATCILFLMPIMFFNMKLFNSLEHQLCRLVNDHWISVSYYTGLQVREYGKDVEQLKDKKCLLIANHLGLVDHFVVMTSLHNKGNIAGSWMWVIYNIWKYTPLGAMWTMHGNFFVNGGPNKKAALLNSFKTHLKKYFTKHEYSWIVLYPEGSRYYLVKDSATKFAEKHGLKPLKHCVYPRTGATHAVLDVLAPQTENPSLRRDGEGEPVTYLIDATLGYPKGDVASVGDTMVGDYPHNDSRVAIHYDVVPIDSSLADEEKLREFLYERFTKKSELLDEFYRTGHFPGERNEPVVPSLQRMFFSQVFWFGAYYIHHVLWIRPVWNLFINLITSF